MCRSNLHLKLKAITGESAIDFIRKVRFKRATELLKSGRYTVTEVSSMVGFNSSSYFATRLKKYTCRLPTVYIKKVKGQALSRKAFLLFQTPHVSVRNTASLRVKCRAITDKIPEVCQANACTFGW